MGNSVWVAIITVLGSVIGAAITAGLTFYFTKKHQLEVEWQHEKLEHYKKLMAAMSDLAVDGKNKNRANMQFSEATNTIALVASQEVVSALMTFHNEIKYSNPNKSPEKHDELLKQLILAIRKDIGLSKKDNEQSFDFHLIGSQSK